MENQTDVNVEATDDVNEKLAAVNKKLAEINRDFIHQFKLMQREACIKVRDGRASELTEEETIIIERLDIDKDNPEDPRLLEMFVKVEAPKE